MFPIRMTVNWEDGKLHLENTGFVPREEFDALRAQGFKFIRSEGYFSAAYSPAREKFLRDGYKLETVEDDDSTPSLVDRLEAKGERFGTFSENAEKRSDAAFNASRNATAGIEFGQPILVGHHSEGAHRRALKRSDNAMRKAVDESRKAEYWKNRAQSALARAKKREMPSVVFRRIKELEANERKFERELARENESKTPHPASVWHWERWLWFTRGRLAYERALFQEVKGEEALPTIAELEKGGAVRFGATYYPIIRVNRKTVTVKHWLGVEKLTYPIPRDKIDHYLPPQQWEEATKIETQTGYIISKK